MKCNRTKTIYGHLEKIKLNNQLKTIIENLSQETGILEYLYSISLCKTEKLNRPYD